MANIIVMAIGLAVAIFLYNAGKVMLSYLIVGIVAISFYIFVKPIIHKAIRQKNGDTHLEGQAENISFRKQLLNIPKVDHEEIHQEYMEKTMHKLLRDFKAYCEKEAQRGKKRALFSSVLTTYVEYKPVYMVGEQMYDFEIWDRKNLEKFERELDKRLRQGHNCNL